MDNKTHIKAINEKKNKINMTILRYRYEKSRPQFSPNNFLQYFTTHNKILRQMSKFSGKVKMVDYFAKAMLHKNYILFKNQ